MIRDEKRENNINCEKHYLHSRKTVNKRKILSWIKAKVKIIGRVSHMLLKVACKFDKLIKKCLNLKKMIS